MPDEPQAPDEPIGLPDDRPTICPNPECPSDGKTDTVVWVMEHVLERNQEWNDDWQIGDDPEKAGNVTEVNLVESAPALALCLECEKIIDVNQDLFSSLDEVGEVSDDDSDSESSGNDSSDSSD